MSTRRTGSERLTSSSTSQSTSGRTPRVGDIITGRVVGVLTPVIPVRFIPDSSRGGSTSSSRAIEGSTSSSSRAISLRPTDRGTTSSKSGSSSRSTPTASRTTVTTDTLETSQGKITHQVMTREQISGGGNISGSVGRLTSSATMPSAVFSRLPEPATGFSTSAQRLLAGGISMPAGSSRGHQSSSQGKTVTQGTSGTARTVTQGGSAAGSRSGTVRSVQHSQSHHSPTARNTEYRSTPPPTVAASSRHQTTSGSKKLSTKK